MSDTGTEITTPVGRIVWGNPAQSRHATDAQNNKRIGDDGQPIEEWSFGLAIPKAEFQAVVWPAMAAEIQKGYPNGVPAKFSYKYVDGDGVDGKGKSFADRPGYAGCFVLSIVTQLQAPGIFKFENGAYRQIQPNEIKTGDFVRVGINFKVNVPSNPTHTPSIYVNPNAIELIGYGEEIQNGYQADPNAIFGGQQVALPPGASATPMAGANQPHMPGMGAQAPDPNMAAAGQPASALGMPPAQPAGAAPAQPGMQPAPAAGAPGMPPPAQGFVDQAGNPQAAPMNTPMSDPNAAATGYPAAASPASGNMSGMQPAPAAGAPGMPPAGQPMGAPGMQPAGQPGAAMPGQMPPR